MSHTPGNTTSEYDFTKYLGAVSAAAPVVAALAAKYLDAPITPEQVIDLAKHALLGMSAAVCTYTAFRSILKSRGK